MKWYLDKKSPQHKQENTDQHKAKSSSDAYEGIFGKVRIRGLSWYGFRFTSSKDNHHDKGTPKTISSSAEILHNVQKKDGMVREAKSEPVTPARTSFSCHGSSRTSFSVNGQQRCSLSIDGGCLSRSSSTRDGNPIRFSYSVARKKPPPVEKPLECTLEELLQGCTKKITITRDVLADSGLMVEEQETVCIKVKPGWKKGTKITFEGIGDERPGMLPCDVIFSVVELEHPMFKRDGFDLVLEQGVSLVQALTADQITVPLLGGESVRCPIDEVIYPGYQLVIEGQGMRISADPIPKRGNLRVNFHVDFPTQLRAEQRSQLHELLQHIS